MSQPELRKLSNLDGLWVYNVKIENSTYRIFSTIRLSRG